LIALFHTWVWLLGATTGFVDQGGPGTSALAAPEQSVREWTSASGDRRAHAALVRVEGDKLWLRTAAGRLATTTKAAVSVADRQYLAEFEAGLAARHSAARRAGWGPQAVPAALVYVRVSRELIEDYVQRSVRTRKPVRDCVLGTRIVGQSDTIGQTHLRLLPSRSSIAGELGFSGTVFARTTGYNGPAIFQYRSEASFRASKLISLGEAGLHVAPAVAVAPTDLQTVGVRTTLPGLRGRIGTRIAARRDASSRCEAEAIISRHSAATIREDFDDRIEQSIAKVKRVLEWKVPGLDLEREAELVLMRCRSTAEYVELAVLRRNAAAAEYGLRPPMVEGDPDIAIRINRHVLGRAMADSELTERLSPLVVNVLGSRFVEKAIAAARPSAEQTAESAKWTMDDDWVSVEFSDAARLRARRADVSALSAE